MKAKLSPEALTLIVCACALCAAPQVLDNYDQTWWLIANLLYVAAIVVYFKILVAKLPGSQGRILISAKSWERAKNGLMWGIALLVSGAAWLIWSPDQLQASPSLDATFIFRPGILFETIGTVLVVYWIALWMFGLVRSEPKANRTQSDAND
jgi:hypothetical protein